MRTVEEIVEKMECIREWIDSRGDNILYRKQNMIDLLNKFLDWINEGDSASG